MIEWIGAAFLVVGFVILMGLFRLVDRGKDVFVAARRSMEVVRSSTMSDDEKQAALQKGALELFRLFFALASGGVVAAAVPFLIVWGADRLGWISLHQVIHITVSPVFMVVSTVWIVLVLWIGSMRKRPASDYSATDRLLHRIAFRLSGAQVAIADFEDRMVAKELAACEHHRPVFITALPRAGTTLLLELISRSPEFASHCYRDMPFVLIPCLWSRFSTRFRTAGSLRERAHGDGMFIDFDSPEALEEVVWKAFWRKHYRNDRIVPWDENEDNDEFNDFFRNHMRKIILLRRETEDATVRYVSKNNLNIARLAMLRRLFPESTIVVPFRDPLQHVSSLLEQHVRFLQIHKEDAFASEYMRAIGHYDFGANLRPVDFDSWVDRARSTDASHLAFWLEYWIAGYRHMLDQPTGLVNFFDYEALCQTPTHGMEILANTLQSSKPEALLAAAEGIRSPRPRQIDTESVPAELLREAREIHAALQERVA